MALPALAGHKSNITTDGLKRGGVVKMHSNKLSKENVFKFSHTNWPDGLPETLALTLSRAWRG